MNQFANLEISEEIATVTLDAPGEKVNVLGPEPLEELAELARQLASQGSLRGVILLSAKPGGFVAGADIDLIAAVSDPQLGADLARQGQEVFDLWAALKVPVVAALHGHCMGGGTELALACHYRVAAESLKIALPEVQLGILPGFGGSQRLPRLMGLEAALDMMLTGRTLSASKARRTGLVDAVVPVSELLAKAHQLIREPVRRKAVERARKARSRHWRRLLLDGNPLGRRLVFDQARKGVMKKTAGHYPAPLRIIELVAATCGLPLPQGLALEAAALGELIVTPESKNLVQVYHLSQRPKKIFPTFEGRTEISRAGVLGAGVMGAGIAWLLADRKVPVALKDISERAVTKGLEHIRNIAGERAKGDRRVVDALLGRVTGQTDNTGFAATDLIIEAVVEKLPVKQSVLQEVEPELADHAIFASNTSALSISRLQEVARRPQRIAGLHFFNPVEKMPLVEVVRGDQTDEPTLQALAGLALRLGKIPIMVADRPGFLVNRLLGVYLAEACLIAEGGTSWHSLDQLVWEFGLPMGPFRLLDEVGIDIGAEVFNTLAAAFPYLKKSLMLERLIERQLLGKKGGLGFYRYQDGKSTGVNPDCWPLDQARSARPEDLRRLLLVMVNEAGRSLDEKVIASAEDIDTGMIFGTGFPPFRGGLCRWADQEGLPRIREELQVLSSEQGPRFEPAGYLQEHDCFYAQAKE